MELNNNGLIVSVYAHGKEWKVAHCARIGSRFGKAIVQSFKSEKAAMVYARAA